MPVAVRVPNHDDTIMRKIIEGEDVIWLAMQETSNKSPSSAKSAIDRATLEMAQRRVRRPRNPVLCEETARSETARNRSSAETLRNMREGGFRENCRALEVRLESEGRLSEVETVINKANESEQNFLKKNEFLLLSNRRKESPIPTKSARLRKQLERKELEDELQRLEKAISKEAAKKESQYQDASNSKKIGSAFARKSNDATAHFRSMTGTKSEQLYVNRNGGYTTFKDPANC